MGKHTPGHETTIIDPDTGEPGADPGTVGEIAIKADTPMCFVEYWNQPEKTDKKYYDEWM
jgi:acyl-coenzyme A synthetase/AMP-(fatty) acid ligase